MHAISHIHVLVSAHSQDVLGHWEVPIYNDTYVMLFFGLVKKLVSRYLTDSPDKASALQNDLLCGQGEGESPNDCVHSTRGMFYHPWGFSVSFITLSPPPPPLLPRGC